MIRLLGPISVDDVSGSSIRLGGRVPSAVLAFMTLAQGRAVTVEGLIDQIWDDPPEAARNAVQVAVSKLRKGLGAALIAGGREGYRLRTDLVAVDLFNAQRLVEQARTALLSGQAGSAVESAGLALDLFTGEPLAGLDSHAAGTARQSVVDLRRDLVICRAEAHLALGQPGEAVTGLRHLVEVDPYCEAAVALMMDALLACGRASDALEVYEQLRHRLADELGLDPSPMVGDAQQRALNNRPRHPTEGDAHPRGPLSWHLLAAQEVPAPASPIYGRDDETRDILALFERGQRLVAITGPGGIGKTRVALAIAEAAARQAGRPVAFVDLTVCTESAMVQDTVQAIIDPDRNGFRRSLAGSAALIVLDNAEHVLEGVVTVTDQLLQEPSVAVLVTSQRPLRLRDARNIALGPLATSGPDSPALRMLADRAGLNDEATGDLDALIELTDGHPLTVELVAAALVWTTVQQLAAGLADHVEDLQEDAQDRPGRHTSLAAALSWSIADCSEEARTALGALTVFRGPFPQEAAIAVIAAALDSPNARPMLADLLDHCLLERLPEPRRILFRLLEPVRLAAMAAESVPAASGPTRHAHAQYYLDAILEADRLDDRDALVRDVLASHANIHEAVNWAWDHDPEALAAALGSILRSWDLIGEHEPVLTWSDRLLKSTQGSNEARARVSFVRACALMDIGQTEPGAVAGLAAALEPYAEALNEEWYRSWITFQVDNAVQRGDLDQAITWLDQSHLMGSPANRAREAHLRGYVHTLRGEYDLAVAMYERGLSDAVEGSSSHVQVLSALGYVELARGRLQQAHDYLSEASSTVATSQTYDHFHVQTNLAWLELESEMDRSAIQRVTILVNEATGLMEVHAATELVIIAGLAAHRLSHSGIARELAAYALALPQTAGMIDPFVASRLTALVSATGATRPDAAPTTDRIAATLRRLVSQLR